MWDEMENFGYPVWLFRDGWSYLLEMPTGGEPQTV